MQSKLSKQIDEKYQIKYCYHMTHIANLSSILTEGYLLSYNQMRGRSYFNSSNDDVQAGRASITVPCSSKPLHDYVPLYMGFKVPMVACNKENNEDLLFLRFDLNFLSLGDVVITDGNARSASTQFKIFKALNDLEIWDPKSIKALKYAYDPEVKRKKQSEILAPEKLSISYVFDIICFSSVAKIRIEDILTASGVNIRIVVNPHWYFPA